MGIDELRDKGVSSRMDNYHLSKKYAAILIVVVLLVLAGGCITDTVSPPATGTPADTPTLPPGHPPLSAIIATPYPTQIPAASSMRFTPDPITGCPMNPLVPEPVDTSVPVRDPMPGIRYSINESESGRTVVLEKGEIVEITLRWAPGVAWTWDVPVYGCSLELVNDGYYSMGGDFWNQSGHYRARYRAKSPGRSFIDGVFGVPPRGTATSANPRFNLTVIVK